MSFSRKLILVLELNQTYLGSTYINIFKEIAKQN